MADDSASADHLAADMLSQAEHDPLAAALCITTSPALADKLAQAIEEGGGALYRHLADEEDLVIPILALRAE